ncbi:hypothetical protein BX600DRAFT_454587 [Xylariales sp. PMI_506]|nr:hypothetical protein BX600DRAFT_454587 [Xylariales sp. PMI_506]
MCIVALARLRLPLDPNKQLFSTVLPDREWQRSAVKALRKTLSHLFPTMKVKDRLAG